MLSGSAARKEIQTVEDESDWVPRCLEAGLGRYALGSHSWDALHSSVMIQPWKFRNERDVLPSFISLWRVLPKLTRISHGH